MYIPERQLPPPTQTFSERGALYPVGLGIYEGTARFTGLGLDVLSPKQCGVSVYTMVGLSAKEAGKELGATEGSVRSALSRTYKKLDIYGAPSLFGALISRGYLEITAKMDHQLILKETEMEALGWLALLGNAERVAEQENGQTVDQVDGHVRWATRRNGLARNALISALYLNGTLKASRPN